MKSKPVIIGFMGLAGSGKTTATDLLKAKHHAVCVSMAEPLKKSLSVLGLVKNEKPQLYRKAAQMLGGMIRFHDPEFFVKSWADAVTDIITENPHSIIVCDDIRYKNEVDYIHHLGGKIVYLDAFDRIHPDLSKKPYTHESEKLAISVLRSIRGPKKNVPKFVDSYVDNNESFPTELIEAIITDAI